MALTSVVTLEAWLGATQSALYTDAQKAAAVAQAISMIETYTGRTFDATDYIQWVDGSGTQELVIDQYPVIKVYRVSTCGKDTFTIENSSSLPYTVNITPNDTMQLTVAGATTSELTLSDYTTLALMKAAVDAIGTWTMNVLTEDIPKHIRPMIGNGVSGGLIQIESPDDDNDIIVNSISPSVIANYFGFPGGYANIFISYSAGYETADLPADLTNTATQLAADVVRGVTNDKSMKSEKIGDYSYTRGDSTQGNLAPYLETLCMYREL